MRLTSVLGIVLVASTFALAQVQSTMSTAAPVPNAAASDKSSQFTPLGPWNVSPDQRRLTKAAQFPSVPLFDDHGNLNIDDRVARYVASIPTDPRSQTPHIRVAPDGQADSWVGDNVCYTMRSYVVARDEKGSDSTHPVSSSFCQPGSRFHVKTAEARSSSGQRER